VFLLQSVIRPPSDRIVPTCRELHCSALKAVSVTFASQVCVTAVSDITEKGEEASSGTFLTQSVMQVQVIRVNHECDTVNSCVKSRPVHKLFHFLKYLRTISTVVFECVGGGKVHPALCN